MFAWRASSARYIIALFRLSTGGFHLTSSFSPASSCRSSVLLSPGLSGLAHASVQIRNPDAPIDRIRRSEAEQ